MKKTKSKNSNYKKLACKYCNNIVERVDDKSISVTCSKCTFKLCEGEYLELSK
jgi:ribosomal protein S27E